LYFPLNYKYKLHGVFLSKLEVFASQVINHRFDLTLVSHTFVGNTREIELFLWRLKTASLPNEVGASIIIDSDFPLILAISLGSHRVEGTLLSSTVELR
jgi:hypothetical protein